MKVEKKICNYAVKVGKHAIDTLRTEKNKYEC